MSTRAARRADRRKQKQPRAPGRSFPAFTVLVVAVVVVFAFFLLKSLGVFDAATINAGPNINPSSVQQNAGQPIPVMGNEHLQANQRFPGTYNSTPPTSGPHDPSPLSWGVYATTQPDEKMLHNLEHGGVLIAYSPSIGDDVLAQLKSIRSRYPRDKYNEVKIILEPYPKLGPGQIALAAWGWLDKMDAYDERRIVGFVATHADHGPEDAP